MSSVRLQTADEGEAFLLDMGRPVIQSSILLLAYVDLSVIQQFDDSESDGQDKEGYRRISTILCPSLDMYLHFPMLNTNTALDLTIRVI